MAFIGTPLDTRNTFQSLQGKRFNGDGSTTAFTLDVAPSSTLDIEVFVGNVRQDPNSAYTLYGTTLTFTGAPPSGTNNIYVVHQAKSVGTIDVPSSYKSEAQTISGARTHTGAITANAGITMGGTTPTLTIGDAGAEDAKIVFDGNAQDYHIGLDDSADDLVIGKGSALGTTAHIVTDENGTVIKPLQPVFLVIPNADQADLATGSTTAAWGAEVFDVGSNFASNTFTAPVTGKYQFNVSLYLSQIDIDTTLFDVNMVASNRTQRLMAANFAKDFSADGNNFHSMNASTILDMDASDTVTVRIDITGGGGVIHLNGTAPASEFYTNWSGALIC